MPFNSNTSLRVIIVEDEPKLRENFTIGLTHYGFDVRGVADGAAFDAAIAQRPTDVIVLDLGLPGEDGLHIAKRVRDVSDIGIIIVSARGLTEERVQGFDCGADLYFVKPVDLLELAAAIRSLGRRTIQNIVPEWRIEPQSSSLLTPNKVRVRLNTQETAILKLLLEQIGKDVSRAALLNAIDLPNEVSFFPRLDVMLSRLRAKVRTADSMYPLPIQTRYSHGYSFLKDI